ncbi:DUF3810 domain-containing protein [Lentiprolixibacter aurantiacus]|uniref:DUF3810 domain-containing protein n=1 Tax=Lentiprolixibacter aurantiacus TaxID=2993939 RepID=A0AAE3MNF9_9FLAO|nr:DUF3810 domain-containing protein [Lentiprolixibacter aurantiacus]MCX2720428.1 DUF3810 domain-containing protein [Lentiprolixibacter aurantiacus]
MKNRWINGIALSLIPQVILVRVLALFPEWIEQYYSLGIFPVISGFFRTLLGWIPFSVGDILYTLFFVLAIRYLYSSWTIYKGRPVILLRDIAMVLAVVHFTFYFSWGLNYFRQPLHQYLKLEKTYEVKDLYAISLQLVGATNSLQEQITDSDSIPVSFPFSKSEVFDMTLAGYDALQQEYPALGYSRPSVKRSLLSIGLSYMGYGGYLNPFTHEAQVNGKLPKFRYPVVAGHEIGHQLGYSAENEVSFIGYLATLRNKNIYFQYSAYAYALGYCLRDLRLRDKEAWEELRLQINPGVKANYQEVTDFWKQYENPLEPIFKSAFNTFLKANKQKKGIKSYNQVVSLIVNYHLDNPVMAN